MWWHPKKGKRRAHVCGAPGAPSRAQMVTRPRAQRNCQVFDVVHFKKKEVSQNRRVFDVVNFKKSELLGFAWCRV